MKSLFVDPNIFKNSTLVKLAVYGERYVSLRDVSRLLNKAMNSLKTSLESFITQDHEFIANSNSKRLLISLKDLEHILTKMFGYSLDDYQSLFAVQHDDDNKKSRRRARVEFDDDQHDYMPSWASQFLNEIRERTAFEARDTYLVSEDGKRDIQQAIKKRVQELEPRLVEELKQTLLKANEDKWLKELSAEVKKGAKAKELERIVLTQMASEQRKRRHLLTDEDLISVAKESNIL